MENFIVQEIVGDARRRKQSLAVEDVKEYWMYLQMRVRQFDTM